MKRILNVFGDYSTREIRRITPMVKKIKELEDMMGKLSDDELKNKTNEFKKRLDKGESLDDVLVEAFAVVREASFRVLGMKHYDVQLMGGIILHQGRIAEMKTGEGKTLVSTLPAYLNALNGQGVHVVTTNEYLAKRDQEEMGQVHEFLGLTTGVILHDMSPDERREIYKCDIVYGINSEIGFDYLRDNMVLNREERVQRGLNYVVVDEIDSILIDEARTPLIISGPGDESTDYYVKIDKFVKSLDKNKDVELDEKRKVAILTEDGMGKLEKYFDIENYADLEHNRLQHYVSQSLKANFMMHRDRDYIEDAKGEILIVDTFTGRVMDGRRFSDGLHQAIEAKEGVEIKPESKTLATITLQNLFKIYNKLSGMSGTVVTEEEEFREIYGVDVVVIPTNRPIQRIDRDFVVYKTLGSKYHAIVKEVEESYKKGQPVLVGTASIQKSEDVSFLLKRKRIPHLVLNAKNHEEEARIIERAGKVKAVTIATNMAGRGTDIKLDKESYDLGGLKVIGTEKHDSRRVDNQLKGRSGRQGDPGESIFFLSLEDDVVKNYISEKYKKLVEKLIDDESKPLTPKVIDKAVINAQKAVEGDHYGARKNIVKYDDAINKQREVIYKQRNEVLDKDDVSSYIKNMFEDVVHRLIFENLDTEDDEVYEKGLKKVEETLIQFNYIKNHDDFDKHKTLGLDEMYDIIIKDVKEMYEKYEERLGKEILNEIERATLLRNVDRLWIDYLEDVAYLRQGINLRSYKQVDPAQIFQLESSKMFESVTSEIKFDTVKEILIQLTANEEGTLTIQLN